MEKTHREGHVKMEVEAGVVLPQAKEHQGLPAVVQELGEGHEMDSPPEHLEGTNSMI